MPLSSTCALKCFVRLASFMTLALLEFLMPTTCSDVLFILILGSLLAHHLSFGRLSFMHCKIPLSKYLHLLIAVILTRLMLIKIFPSQVERKALVEDTVLVG